MNLPGESLDLVFRANRARQDLSRSSNKRRVLMEFPEALEQFRVWAFDLSGTWQRVMWAAVAVLAGYILGAIIARIVGFLSRRLVGLASRKSEQKEERTSADHVVLDILGSVIRASGLMAGVAGAAWVFGFPIETLQDWAVRAGIALVILVAVWFLGSWLSSRVRNFGEKVGRRAGAGGQTLFGFLASLVRFGALAIGIIAALQQLYFPVASLVAVVGAAGLAIALALQDTLKAVAAGVIIAIFRPYRIGDVVQLSGETGTVADITPFTTTLTTIDNKEVTVTNDKAWGDVITNHTARRLRRIDHPFSISYDDDIDKAIAVVRDVFEADDRVRKEPPVWVNVTDLGSSSVDLRVRAWCATGDWWDLRCDMIRGVKQAFDREGITIPYPHQVEIQKEPFVLRAEPGTLAGATRPQNAAKPEDVGD